MRQAGKDEQEPQEAADGPSRARPFVATLYCAANIVVAACIVFVNKAVFAHYGFKFVVALTWLHTVFTWAGMSVLAALGFFTPKELPAAKLIPLALGFVGYVVISNVSLQINSVGFYQIMKIAIAPTVVVMEYLMFNKLPSLLMLISVFVVCAGIAGATVMDTVAIHDTRGLAVGAAATLIAALYQIWAGSKQRELQANSSQLLHAYTPHAIWLLGVLVPVFEDVGWSDPRPDTLLGFPYSVESVCAIFLSAVLGILVSLTTFLVIGTTSSLTYNMVSNLKTVIILAGGVLLFGDSMPLERFLGVCMAMFGIIWYTQLLAMQSAASATRTLLHKPAAKPSSGSRGGAPG